MTRMVASPKQKCTCLAGAEEGAAAHARALRAETSCGRCLRKGAHVACTLIATRVRRKVPSNNRMKNDSALSVPSIVPSNVPSDCQSNVPSNARPNVPLKGSSNVCVECSIQSENPVLATCRAHVSANLSTHVCTHVCTHVYTHRRLRGTCRGSMWW